MVTHAFFSAVCSVYEYNANLVQTFGMSHIVNDVGFILRTHSGATLQHTQTRRPPHCFNFLRQVEIIERSGGAGVTQQMEDCLSVFHGLQAALSL